MVPACVGTAVPGLGHHIVPFLCRSTQMQQCGRHQTVRPHHRGQLHTAPANHPPSVWAMPAQIPTRLADQLRGLLMGGPTAAARHPSARV